MTIIDLLPLILFFTLVSLALCAVVHRWAYHRGAASERIKLQGNTLPRYENAPPPPPRECGWTPIESTKPEYYREVLAQLENGSLCIVWRANDGQKDIYTIQCSDRIVEPVFWRPLPKPLGQKASVDKYPLTESEVKAAIEMKNIWEKDRGVPTMPNHPEVPDEMSQLKAQGVSLAEDYLKEYPQTTPSQAFSKGFSLAVDLALAAHRINKVKESLHAGRQNGQYKGKIEARGIKFRIWDRETARWYKPVFEAYKGRLHELLLTTEGELCLRSMEGFTHESKFPNRYVVQRFAGLMDKNGKEIYEGDIVKDRFGRIMEVKRWNYRLCWVAITDTNFHHADLFDWVGQDEEGNNNDIARVEVIGNRYENPELLHPTESK